MRLRSHAVRWLVAGLLLFGLATMHHLVASNGSADAAQHVACCADGSADEHHLPQSPNPLHEVLHICVAVLAAASVLLLRWLFLGMAPGLLAGIALWIGDVSGVRRRGPPALPIPARLALLGMLRC